MKLEQLKEILPIYFSSKPILKAWIFGSYARGEEKPESDIDILVDFDHESNLNLFSIASIILGLENLSGKRIDLIDHERIFPEIAPIIEKEKILVYERS